MSQQKIDYGELTTDYEFAPVSFQPDGEMVAVYLSAIEGDKSTYEQDKIVPPMAIAALAMAAMSEGLVLPPGTVHVSQELQFLSTVSINETLTSYARVSHKVARGKFHMLTVGINVLNQKQVAVLTGETSFILPLS
jgi:acyl dehydratase